MFRKGLPSCEGKNGKVVLVKEGHEVRHHPILDYADLSSSSIDEIGPSLSTILSYRTRGFNSVPPALGKQVIDLECMNEYATSPPSRHIRLDLVPSTNCSSKWIEVINDNGVKVVDVFKVSSTCGRRRLLNSFANASNDASTSNYSRRFCRNLKKVQHKNYSRTSNMVITYSGTDDTSRCSNRIFGCKKSRCRRLY